MPGHEVRIGRPGLESDGNGPCGEDRLNFGPARWLPSRVRLDSTFWGASWDRSEPRGKTVCRSPDT